MFNLKLAKTTLKQFSGPYLPLCRALWYILLIEPVVYDFLKCKIQVQMMARVVEGNVIAQNLAIWG